MFDTTNMHEAVETHKGCDPGASRATQLCDAITWAAAQKLPAQRSAVLVQLTCGLSRDQIAEHLSLTTRQVAAILDDLAEKGFVLKTKAKRAGRGRPANVYTPNFGSAFPEASFQKSNSGSRLQETGFQKSDLRKVASGNALPEITSKNPETVDNPPAPCIGTGARAETLNLNTRASDLIGSDQASPPTKKMIDALCARAGDACNVTRGGVHHGADLTRFLRAGCTWEDIEFATDKLAASFRGRRQQFATWALLEEHVTEIRDRRLAGLAPVAAPVSFQRRAPASNGGYRSNGIRPMVATG